MIRKALGMALMALAGLVLFYISRFWDFALWSGPLFGVEDLRPGGGLLQSWLNGTPLAPYELLVWLVLSFLTLTWLEWLLGKVWPLPPADEAPHD